MGASYREFTEYILKKYRRIDAGERNERSYMFLTVREIQKYYGEGKTRHLVLDRVSFSIEEGSILVVMGPSGSGKSTLLHCIGGLEHIDGGSIEVDGVELSGLNDKKLLAYRRASLGFVFQFYNLIPNLTVAENVDVCRYLSGSPLDRDELLGTLGLSEKKDSFPRELSGGEQQRCAIARALVKNPKLLLCDEPTGALDSHTSREILCLLDEINRKYNTTVIIVTHNEAIKPMADHLISMSDGAVADSCKNADKRPAALLEGI